MSLNSQPKKRTEDFIILQSGSTHHNGLHPIGIKSLKRSKFEVKPLIQQHGRRESMEMERDPVLIGVDPQQTNTGTYKSQELKKPTLKKDTSKSFWKNTQSHTFRSPKGFNTTTQIGRDGILHDKRNYEQDYGRGTISTLNIPASSVTQRPGNSTDLSTTAPKFKPGEIPSKKSSEQDENVSAVYNVENWVGMRKISKI